MLDPETESKVGELAGELYEAHVDDQTIRFWEGGIVQTAPTGAPPEYITVEIEGIYDENVMWRGVPASLIVSDEVVVWENPISHRREIFGGSGATTTSTSSPWQKITVAPSGGDFALLSAAIAYINALPGAIGPAATRQFAVNMLGGTFVEAADVTIPSWVGVEGEGEETVLDMGDASLNMSADSSLENMVVTSTGDDNNWVIMASGADNVVMRDVRVIVTSGTFYDAVLIYDSIGVELYHVIVESTTANNIGFDITWDSVVLLWGCKADDTTNFAWALYILASTNPSTVTTKFGEFRAASVDVTVDTNCEWRHFCTNFDPANSTINGTQTPLRHGYTRFADKVYAGTFGAPVDVQVTQAGQYGFELHYSGNNYDVTALRARASLITTDAAARTAQGAKLQGANSNGIDAWVVQGAIIEGIGKSNADAATISNLRGALVNTEWDDFDTVTDLKTLHVRTHTRHSAGAGYISNTGYLIYLENEAVGGNGQMLDAAIYVKATNVSTPMAFNYGIDFTGAAGEINTADILLSSGGTLGGVGTEDVVVDAAGVVILNNGDLTFAAGSGSNVVTFPDNVANAMHFVDSVTGINFQQFVTTAGAQATVFNIGEQDVDFRVAASGVTNALVVNGATGFVGVGVVPIYHFSAQDLAINTTGTYIGGFFSHAKTAGVTDHNDYMYGVFNRMDINQVGGVVGGTYGIYGEARLTAGSVGTVANQRSMLGIQFTLDLNGGTINGDGFGGEMRVDQEAANTVTGNIYGNRVWVDADGTVTGNVYMLYLSEQSGVDYGFYQFSGGTAGVNHFQGLTSIGGTVAPLAQAHIDQSIDDAAIPVLLLDQADLSEEFIEFTTTVGAGNPIDTAAFGAYYGKARVMVTGVGYKVLALYEET